MEDRSSRWIIENEEPEFSNPEWFDNAIVHVPESRRIVVDVEITFAGGLMEPKTRDRRVRRCRAYPLRSFAPFYADDRPVVAINLSGMGDSGHGVRHGPTRRRDGGGFR